MVTQFGIGYMGVALAFGLTVLTGIYAFGHISGGHFNPAVTLGLWAGNRFPVKDVVPYVAAQVVGAIAAGWILFQIASGASGFAIDPTRSRHVREQWLRQLVAGRLLGRGRVPVRSGDDRVLPDRDHGRDARTRAGRFRRHRDRPGPDADPPDQHPGHQHFGEPGALDRRGAVRGIGCDSASCGCSGWHRSWAALLGGIVYRWLGEDRPDVVGNP